MNSPTFTWPSVRLVDDESQLVGLELGAIRRVPGSDIVRALLQPGVAPLLLDLLYGSLPRYSAVLTAVPIIAVTAYPMSYTHVKAFATACSAYMAKPIDLPKLLELVNRYLPAS